MIDNLHNTWFETEESIWLMACASTGLSALPKEFPDCFDYKRTGSIYEKSKFFYVLYLQAAFTKFSFLESNVKLLILGNKKRPTCRPVVEWTTWHACCPKTMRAKLQSPKSFVDWKFYPYLWWVICLPEQYYQLQNYVNWNLKLIIHPIQVNVQH